MYAVCNFVMNISDFYVEKNGEIRFSWSYLVFKLSEVS